VPGETTAKDVVEALGAPNEVVQLGTRSAYRYDFTVEKTAGFTLIIITFLNDDTRADRAWLFFDKDDVLTHARFDAAGLRHGVRDAVADDPRALRPCAGCSSCSRCCSGAA
jgi:hypothetical protein